MLRCLVSWGELRDKGDRPTSVIRDKALHPNLPSLIFLVTAIALWAFPLLDSSLEDKELQAEVIDIISCGLAIIKIASV